MGKLILKRFLQALPTLLVVITITFVLTRIIPGNPAKTLLGPQASPKDIADMEEKMGLDKSLTEQYFSYMGDVLSGDLGYSYINKMSVTDIIAEKIPNTLILSLSSIAIALVLGVMAGVYSALHQYSAGDYIIMILALVGVSMPIFWMGLMLVNLFSVRLGWLPAIGMGSMKKGFWNVVSHMILPCFCLATIPTATFARISRSSMLEVINSDYIKALRARGINEKSVIWSHAVKNAAPPLVTVLGLQIAGAFTGAIVTESVFSWPGLGTMIVNAINNRDYQLVQGSVLFIAIVFILTNLIVDIVYILINPQVDLDAE